jgi:hypothetical protein
MTIATGERMYAADINNLTFFPVGTILQFSGSAYSRLTSARTEDNKVIWTLCDGTNVNGIDVPNLVDKFIRGGNASGTTGDGKKILSIQEIPSHGHSLTIQSDGSHTHTTTIRTGYGAGGTSSAYQNQNLYSRDNHRGLATGVEYYASSSDGAHSHSDSSADNTGGGEAFDIVPAFYTAVYIMKVA